MTVNTPIVRFENLPAAVQTTLEQERLLIIGQKTSAGTAIEGELYTGLEQGLTFETLAGKNSIGAAMIRAAQEMIEVSEIKPQINAIFFNDATSSVAASGAVVFANNPTAATEDKTIYVTVGDAEKHRYKLDITTGDTATVIGDDLVSAITADDTCPVTAINTAGSVALTAVNKGAEGNKLTIQIEGYVAGISLSITQFTGGSLTPTITSVFTTIANIRMQRIVMPESYDIDAVVTFLETRWLPTPTGIIKDGALIVVLTDTLANLKSSTVAANKKSVALLPNKPVNLLPVGNADLLVVGSAHVQMNYVIAAKIAAISSLRLTPSAEIADYTDAVLSSRDNFGGIHISTLPYHNTPLPGVPLADKRNVWSEEETLELLDAGYGIFGNNTENTAVLIGDVVTRYKTNTFGKNDVSYKYLNYLDQASVVREYMTVKLKERFKQYRLTTGKLIPDFDMANEGSVKSECIKLYGELADAAIMVAGTDAKQLFVNNLIVTINEALGRATVRMINPAVTQLREITGYIELVFTN